MSAGALRNRRIAVAARRLTAALILVAASIPAASETTTRPASAAPDVWAPQGHLGYDWQPHRSYVAGFSGYLSGEHVWIDAVYDDHGADSGRAVTPAARRSALAGHGDVVYPADPARFGSNSADIVELRTAVTGDAVHLIAVLQTLIDPVVTAVGWAIDTGSGERNRGRWPLGAGVRTPRADLFVTAGGGAGWLNGAPLAASGGLVHFDAEQNTVELRLPRSLVRGSKWRVAAGAGVWNPMTKKWARPCRTPTATCPGGPPSAPAVVDAAYVRPGRGWWHDEPQARLLRRGIAPAGGSIDAVSLTRRVSRPAALRPGFATWLHRSSLALGEGVRPQDRYGQRGHGVYLGAFQPYSVYIPPSRPRRAPLLLLLHELGANHRSFELRVPAAVRSLSDSSGRVVVMPFARGEAGWYEAEAEGDVLEAWSDVRRRVRIDPARTSVAGFSMGGGGAVRLGLLYPDRIAAVVSWAGTDAPACLAADARHGNCGRDAASVSSLSASGLGQRVLLMHGGRDAIVPEAVAVRLQRRLRQGGAPHQLVHYPDRGHEGDWPAVTAERTARWLDARVTRAPSRIRYKLPPASVPPVKAVHDGAWWMRGLEATVASRGALADVSTAGLGYVWRAPRPVASEGRDEAGRWSMTGAEQRAPARVRRHQSFSAIFRGASRVRLDIQGMGLDPRRTFTGVIRTDSGIRLELAGALRLASPLRSFVEDGALVVFLPPGEHTLEAGGGL